jgi:hypothetical protein
MTWPEVVSQGISAIQPYLLYFVGLLLLWLLAKITDQSLMGLVKGLVSEFGSLLERKIHPKSINAMGILLLGLLVVFLFSGGLSHIVLPEKGTAEHTDLIIEKGIYATVIFIFGGVIIFSIKVTKYCR